MLQGPDAVSATARSRPRTRIVAQGSLRNNRLLNQFLRSEFARHGFIVFAASTIVNFASYAFNFALSRWLGIADYGALASVVAGLVIGSIPAAILTTVVVKHSAELCAVNDTRRLEGLTRKAFEGSLGLGCLVTSIIVLGRHVIASYLRIGDERIIAVAGAILGLSFVVTTLRGVLQGTQNFKRFAFSTLIEGGLRGILGVSAVALHLGVVGPLLGWLVAEVVALAFIFWSLPTLRPFARAREDILLDWRRIAQSSSAIAMSAIAMTSLGFADMILVKHFFNAHLAGLYGGLSLCGRVFTFGLSFLPTIMLPKATARAMRGEAALPVLAAAGAISVTLAFIVIAAVALAPRLALEVLVGDAYRGAAPLVMPYCIAVTFLTLTSIVITYKTAMHRFDFVLPTVIVAAGEIAAIDAFHGSIATVVAILVWGNFLALVGACWRIWSVSATTNEPAFAKNEQRTRAAS